MTEETSVVDPQTVPAQSEPAVDPVETQQAPAESSADQASKSPPAWFVQRIGVKTAEVHREREARQVAEAEAASLRERLSQALSGNAPPPTHQQPAPYQAPNVDELVEQKLRERSFNDACNRVFEAGQKEEGQAFSGKVGALRETFSMDPGYRTLIEATTQLPDGHKLLSHLGGDLQEASRIMSLPPVAMAFELSRIATEIKSPAISSAPPPIKPISGGVAPSIAPLENGEFRDQAHFKAWKAQQGIKR